MENVTRRTWLLAAFAGLWFAAGPHTSAAGPELPGPHSAFVPAGGRLAWHDEFDGTELDRTKWGFPGYKVRDAAQMNTPGTVVLDGSGVLRLVARADGTGTVHAAIIDTRGRMERAYGYYEARIKFQRQQGIHGCFWVQTPTFRGASNEPARSGTEMDIIEWFGSGRRSGWAGMNVYYWGGTHNVRSPSIPDFAKMGGPEEGDPKSPVGDLSDGFRTYGLLWTPEKCVFTCDGVEIMRDTQAVSKVPQYIVLSLLCSHWERPRLKLDQLPDEMAVDYVRVYDVAP
jgi:beta-glucanase (GH16 family)